MTVNNVSIRELDRPWGAPWPANGLEKLGRCPICGERDRRTLNADLVDNTFWCSPGTWHLWQCTNCRSAYLDPRPTPETISIAYKNYYTHHTKKTKLDFRNLTFLRRLRRGIVNDYVDWRFGAKLGPVLKFGAHLIRVLPIVRRKLDWEFRSLPKAGRKTATLLDLGCGNGQFILSAKEIGWNVVGIDTDPKAVLNAQSLGLNVKIGGIEHFDGQAGLFDAITISHVIEHVHDPIKIIQRCYDLLKPGGQLWVETPNIESIGYKIFKNNWRGIEAPRHLVIFSPHSLRKLFRSCGFSNVTQITRPFVAKSIFSESLKIEAKSRSSRAGKCRRLLASIA